MVIKYDNKNEKLMKMLSSEYGNYNVWVQETKTNNGYSISTPYGSKEETYEEKGRFGKIKIQNRNVIDKSKKGFAILCADGENKTYNDSVIYVGRDEERNEHYISINEETLMPELVNPPQTLEEAILLVKTDPRFASQINPALIAANNQATQIDKNLTRITIAASDGVDEIMGYQANYGIAYNEKEDQETTEYIESCKNAVAFLTRACRQYASQKQSMMASEDVRQ